LQCDFLLREKSYRVENKGKIDKDNKKLKRSLRGSYHLEPAAVKAVVKNAVFFASKFLRYHTADIRQ